MGTDKDIICHALCKTRTQSSLRDESRGGNHSESCVTCFLVLCDDKNAARRLSGTCHPSEHARRLGREGRKERESSGGGRLILMFLPSFFLSFFPFPPDVALSSLAVSRKISLRLWRKVCSEIKYSIWCINRSI